MSSSVADKNKYPFPDLSMQIILVPDKLGNIYVIKISSGLNSKIKV
jgi:hypothetical protein